MRAMRRVTLTTYRRHWLEVFDDQGDGWHVVIHPPVAAGRIPLENRVPSGLAVLVAEARAHGPCSLGRIAQLGPANCDELSQQPTVCQRRLDVGSFPHATAHSHNHSLPEATG